MEEQSATRRVLVAVVEGRRQRGRPKLRWEDGVMEDARKLGEREVGGMLRKEQRQLAEASEEDLGSKGAVVPMMIMMMMSYRTEIFTTDIFRKLMIRYWLQSPLSY